MAEKTRNLCAEIPLELHTKVRQRQAESGETLSRYMTALITKFYEMEENVKMSMGTPQSLLKAYRLSTLGRLRPCCQW